VIDKDYFGLFALTGKITSFVGPLLIGLITGGDGKPEGGDGGAGAVFLALLGRVGEFNGAQ
jgi:MFS transporter, UMF1 family